MGNIKGDAGGSGMEAVTVPAAVASCWTIAGDRVYNALRNV